ncbi:TPR domain-containing protein [Plectosphaerella plurivora]|uniref:TPR domain-containing protein n=1 Tax=Plectosphaerella plurivora TaxID=936078 RepID=A0A9P8V2C5_9PEZI|nr:TPR domain-containing protein [Plectosphaerella plurivora]
MAGQHTLYMSPAESERVRTSLQDRLKGCLADEGKTRETNDPDALIQGAVSTALMQDFAAGAFGLGAPKKESMPAYTVGHPYPPSLASVEDLKPMTLADLRMETHHRGHVIKLRRVSPVVELAMSSWAVVQGEESSDVERLTLFLHKKQNGKDLLDTISEFQVKEPYFTRNDQDEPTIRIDHPSDLVVLSYKETQEQWRQRSLDTTDESAEAPSLLDFKQRGNKALGDGDNFRSWAYYTQGLKSDKGADKVLVRDVHRNRAHVNLLLNRYDEAKSDALASLTNDPEGTELDAKAHHRAGLASYALGDFTHSQACFEKQKELQGSSPTVEWHLKRVKRRLEEQTTGNYNFPQIVTTLQKLGGRADVASFDGPTVIKESPGAGRGAFAIRAIKTGEIVMAEKPFAVTWSHEPEAVSFMTCDMREDATIRVFPSGLHRAVVQKLMNNPSQIATVLSAFGDYKGTGTECVVRDGVPVVDTFQVHDIIQRNAFGPGAQTGEEDVSNASAGLWVRAACLNHSCVPNVTKSYVGDLMLLKALRPIAKGEELTHAYDETGDYEARAAALQRTWGFECTCTLCVTEKKEDPATRKRRGELEQEAAALMAKNTPSSAGRAVYYKAKRLQAAIAETYSDKTHKGLPRRAGAQLQQWLQAVPAR